jgi:hypothetical protein
LYTVNTPSFPAALTRSPFLGIRFFSLAIHIPTRTEARIA